MRSRILLPCLALLFSARPLFAAVEGAPGGSAVARIVSLHLSGIQRDSTMGLTNLRTIAAATPSLDNRLHIDTARMLSLLLMVPPEALRESHAEIAARFGPGIASRLLSVAESEAGQRHRKSRRGLLSLARPWTEIQRLTRQPRAKVFGDYKSAVTYLLDLSRDIDSAAEPVYDGSPRRWQRALPEETDVPDGRKPFARSAPGPLHILPTHSLEIPHSLAGVSRTGDRLFLHNEPERRDGKHQLLAVDLPSLRQIGELKYSGALRAIAPDDKSVYAQRKKGAPITKFNALTGEALGVLPESGGTLAISPDGRFAAGAGMDGPYYGSGMRGLLSWHLVGGPGRDLWYPAHSREVIFRDGINSIAFSDSGNLLFMDSREGSAKVVRMARESGGDLVGFRDVVWRSHIGPVWETHGQNPQAAFAFMEGDAGWATGNHKGFVSIWKLSQGKPKRFARFRAAKKPIIGLAFVDGNRHLLTATGDGALLWDLRSGRNIAAFDQFPGPGSIFFFSRDRRSFSLAKEKSGFDAKTNQPWRRTTVTEWPIPRLP